MNNPNNLRDEDFNGRLGCDGLSLYDISLTESGKQNILDNQVKAKKKYDNTVDEFIVRFSHIIQLKKENDQLGSDLQEVSHIEKKSKEKLEKIKIHCKDNYRRSETVFTVWFRELEEILEDKII